MRTIAVIPARQGSKRLPGKNILPFARKPLIAWTVEASVEAKQITRTVVTTDSEEIAAISKRYGAEVPFLRPKPLSQDDTPTLPVIQDAVQRIQALPTDLVVILQPTSPLRGSAEIDEAIHMFVSGGDCDSVVSGCEIPHRFSPSKLMRKGSDDFLVDALEPTSKSDEIFYARNGPAIIVTTSEVISKGSLYGQTTRLYEMPESKSIDIDSRLDFDIAEFLMRMQIQSKKLSRPF